MQISYTRYIKNFIEQIQLGQLQQLPREQRSKMLIKKNSKNLKIKKNLPCESVIKKYIKNVIELGQLPQKNRRVKDKNCRQTITFFYTFLELVRPKTTKKSSYLTPLPPPEYPSFWSTKELGANIMAGAFEEVVKQQG